MLSTETKGFVVVSRVHFEMSSAFEVFDHLVNARDVKQLLHFYQKLNELLFLNECVNSFSYFHKLRASLIKSKQILKFNKISSIVQKLEKRSQLKTYQQNSRLNGQRVLVIGGGISGLQSGHRAPPIGRSGFVSLLSSLSLFNASPL